MELLTALGAGIIAGLVVVVPLGPIGVLLIEEGVSHGWPAASAAAAVATVDVIYCTAAVIAASALIALAGWNLLRMLRARAAVDAPVRGRSGRRYAMFLALTAVNPATLIYFAALATVMPSLSDSTGAAALFVVGVGFASVGWQLLLVAAGVLLRWKAGTRIRTATALIGHALVGVLGVALVVGAVSR